MREIAWATRREGGKKIQLKVRMIKGNLSWLLQEKRNNPSHPHQPTEEDWDEFIEEAEKRLKRGNIDPKLMERIRAREA